MAFLLIVFSAFRKNCDMFIRITTFNEMKMHQIPERAEKFQAPPLTAVQINERMESRPPLKMAQTNERAHPLRMALINERTLAPLMMAQIIERRPLLKMAKINEVILALHENGPND